MPTKTEQIIDHMRKGEHKQALSIVHTFHRLPSPIKIAVQRAWSATINPKFYIELGQDPEAIVQFGLDAIRKIYNI